MKNNSSGIWSSVSGICVAMSCGNGMFSKGAQTDFLPTLHLIQSKTFMEKNFFSKSSWFAMDLVSRQRFMSKFMKTDAFPALYLIFRSFISTKGSVFILIFELWREITSFCHVCLFIHRKIMMSPPIVEQFCKDKSLCFSYIVSWKR